MALKHLVYSAVCGVSLVCAAGSASADTVDLRFTGSITDADAYNALLGSSFTNGANVDVAIDFIIQSNPGSISSPGDPATLQGGAPGSVSPVISGSVTFGGAYTIQLAPTADMSSFLSISTSNGEYQANWTAGSSTLIADFFSPDIPSDFFTLTPPIGTNDAIDSFGEFDFTAQVGETNQVFSEDFGLTGMSVTSLVPEPASWVLFLAAFGMTGWAMRLRRNRAVSA